MATTNLGRVRFNPRGDYNPAADPLYSLLDLVSDGGGSFVYTNDTPSNEPTSSASHWQQIASVGGQDILNAVTAEKNAAIAAKVLAEGYAAQLAAGTASPAGTYANLAALTAAAPNTAKIYITLNDGNWCYFNGSAWVAGGVYQATERPLDTTLSVSGMAADAKVTGDKVGELKSAMSQTASSEYTVPSSNIIVGSYTDIDPHIITDIENRLRNRTTIFLPKGWTLKVKPGTNCNTIAVGVYYENGIWRTEFPYSTEERTIYYTDTDKLINFTCKKNNGDTLVVADYDAKISIEAPISITVKELSGLSQLSEKTNDPTKLVWSYGYINDIDGQMRYDKANIVTPIFMFVKKGTTIQSTNSNRFAIKYYSSPYASSIYDRVQFRTNAWTFASDEYIRIIMVKSDSSAITDITALAESLLITNGYLYFINPYIYSSISAVEYNPPAVNKFIEKMNEKAQQIGMTNSLFADVAGYDTATNITTARDLVRLGIEACAYNRLCRVWNTDSYTITTLDKNHREIECEYTDDMTVLNNAYMVLGKKAGYMPLSDGGSTYTMIGVCVVRDDVVVGAIGGASSRENRVKAMKELMDNVSEIMQGNTPSSTPTYYQYGCAAVLPKGNPASYESKIITFIYEKNADTQFVPASTTKTLTAIVALDYITDMHEKMTVISNDGLDYGSGQLIQAGDVLNFEQALYLMMLPSSGPTCRVVARTLGQKMLIAYE